jgi:hypothetical protein
MTKFMASCEAVAAHVVPRPFVNIFAQLDAFRSREEAATLCAALRTRRRSSRWIWAQPQPSLDPHAGAYPRRSGLGDPGAAHVVYDPSALGKIDVNASSIDPHRPHDVFERLFSHVDEFRIDPSTHVLVRRARN